MSKKKKECEITDKYNKRSTRSKGTHFIRVQLLLFGCKCFRYVLNGRVNNSSGSVAKSCKPMHVWSWKQQYASFGIRTWQLCSEKKKKRVSNLKKFESDEPYGIVINRSVTTSENPEETVIVGHFSPSYTRYKYLDWPYKYGSFLRYDHDRIYEFVEK